MRSTGHTWRCRRSTAAGHWLGTDRLGRDLLVRTLHGLRVSLAHRAARDARRAWSIGVGWGALAGYLRGRADALMMRFVDVLYALPQVFFVIILTVVFGRSPPTLLVAIGAFGWLTMARIVRGQALALREREFVEAAVVGGAARRASSRATSCRTCSGPVIVYATLTVPQVILVESFLSFLGIGIQEPLASLGNLIADGARKWRPRPGCCWSRPAASCCSCSASTSWATACATPSTRGTADGAARNRGADRRFLGPERPSAPWTTSTSRCERAELRRHRR